MVIVWDGKIRATHRGKYFFPTRQAAINSLGNAFSYLELPGCDAFAANRLKEQLLNDGTIQIMPFVGVRQ